MSRSRQERQGVALLMAIMFLAALFSLSLLLLAVLPLEMRATGRQKMETEAFYAAEAGVLQALAWMETRAAKGHPAIPSGSDKYDLTGSVANWNWKAEIGAVPVNPSNPDDTRPAYTVRSTAFLGGTRYRSVSVALCQESMSRFAWFEESGSEGLWIGAESFRIDGPFHTNKYIQVNVPSGFYGSNHPSTFTQGVTMAGAAPNSPDGVNYNCPFGTNNPPFDSKGRPIEERYRKIFGEGGSSNVLPRVKKIQLPSHAKDLAAEAWGSGLPPPTQIGVHPGLGSSSNRVEGGLYIVGDVKKMTLAVTGGNRRLTITQGSNTVEVLETVSGTAVAPDGSVIPKDSTMVRTGDEFAVYSGLTNGLVYCTGNINSLSGVNRGKRTIAVDVAQGKDITITADLTRADTSPGQAPTGSRDNLGLVGHNIWIQNSSSHTEANPLDIYAALMGGRRNADGTVSGYVGPTDVYGPLTRVRLFGGLMMGDKQTWGKYSGGRQYSGMTLESRYDSHLANSPPPYFPSIAKFRVVSYREEHEQSAVDW